MPEERGTSAGGATVHAKDKVSSGKDEVTLARRVQPSALSTYMGTHSTHTHARARAPNT